jgi:plasmid stabilization system protein ParE
MKPIRFTTKAVASLETILLWSIDNFGTVQTEKYRNGLLSRIKSLANGEPPTGHPLTRLFPTEKRLAALKFYRVEQHLIIYHIGPEKLVVIDFINAARDIMKLIAETGDVDAE